MLDEKEVILESRLKKQGRVARLVDLKEAVKKVCADEFSSGKLKAADLMGFLSSVSINPKYETFYLDHVSRMFELDENRLMRVVYDHS